MQLEKRVPRYGRSKPSKFRHHGTANAAGSCTVRLQVSDVAGFACWDRTVYLTQRQSEKLFLLLADATGWKSQAGMTEDVMAEKKYGPVEQPLAV